MVYDCFFTISVFMQSSSHRPLSVVKPVAAVLYLVAGQVDHQLWAGNRRPESRRRRLRPDQPITLFLLMIFGIHRDAFVS